MTTQASAVESAPLPPGILVSLLWAPQMGLLLQPDSVLMEPHSRGRDRGSGDRRGRRRIRCGGRVVVF